MQSWLSHLPSVAVSVGPARRYSRSDGFLWPHLRRLLTVWRDGSGRCALSRYAPRCVCHSPHSCCLTRPSLGSCRNGKTSAILQRCVGTAAPPRRRSRNTRSCCQLSLSQPPCLLLLSPLVTDESGRVFELFCDC